MKEYWFEIPPRPQQQSWDSGQQICIRAEESMKMLDQLKQYDNWQEAIFLGYGVKSNETRTKKKPNKQ